MGQLSSQRLDHRAECMTMDQRQTVARQIDISVAINVPQIAALPSLHHRGIWQMEPETTGEAARHRMSRSLHKLRRLGSPFTELLLHSNMIVNFDRHSGLLLAVSLRAVLSIKASSSPATELCVSFTPGNRPRPISKLRENSQMGLQQ